MLLNCCATQTLCSGLACGVSSPLISAVHSSRANTGGEIRTHRAEIMNLGWNRSAPGKTSPLPRRIRANGNRLAGWSSRSCRRPSPQRGEPEHVGGIVVVVNHQLVAVSTDSQPAINHPKQCRAADATNSPLELVDRNDLSGDHYRSAGLAGFFRILRFLASFGIVQSGFARISGSCHHDSSHLHLSPGVAREPPRKNTVQSQFRLKGVSYASQIVNEGKCNHVSTMRQDGNYGDNGGTHQKANWTCRKSNPARDL